MELVTLLLLGRGIWGCPVAAAESTIVNAEGKYVMGDLDTKKDAKALALMDAKRLAIEKAGTYLESRTEVRDLKLTKDQINSLATGILSVEALRKIDQALRLRPEIARHHAVKAIILRGQGEYGAALASASRAIEINPRVARHFMVRGEIYMDLKKPFLARKDFNQACRVGQQAACDIGKKKRHTPLPERRHRP